MVCNIYLPKPMFHMISVDRNKLSDEDALLEKLWPTSVVIGRECSSDSETVEACQPRRNLMVTHVSVPTVEHASFFKNVK